VDNAVACRELDQRKRAVEGALRTRFKDVSRADFGAVEVLRDYLRYYKAFEKTYHVQLQLESIVSKGKSLPNVSPLVDANFVAELETLVLTAGHDAAMLRAPLCIDLSREGEVIVQMNGASKAMRAGDMLMRDADAVSCSILYGQDNRSPISRRTSHVLYVAYAPPGVPSTAVESQLSGILANVRTFAPACSLLQQTLLRAG
jgi:DNA/RNA-binding domain of Phe-tRNA-synthetase-like protein